MRVQTGSRILGVLVFAAWTISCGGGGGNTVTDEGTPDEGPADIIEVEPDMGPPDLGPQDTFVAECTTDNVADKCADLYTDLDQCYEVFCNLEKNFGSCDTRPKTDGAACDDGDPCTKDDTCQVGACTSGEKVCDCASEGDVACAALDDADLCNGSLKCDMSQFPYKCVLDPTTVVTCPTDNDDQCQANQCKTDTGLCEMTPINEDVACKDDSVCTEVTVCKSGVCTSTQDKSCDDQEICTDDTCDATLGCVYVPNTLGCDDGNACTENDVCGKGVCVPGTAKVCDDGKFCTGVETCDPASGCVAGTTPACDDKVACTADSCDTATDKCVNAWLDSAKEGAQGSPTCSDGKDNDCDGEFDGDDPQCQFSITTVAPPEGPSAGGTTVTITGKALDLTKKVVFGSTEVEFTVVSPTQISLETPAYLGAGEVTVTITDDTVVYSTPGNVFRYTAKTTNSLMDATVTEPAEQILDEGGTTDLYFANIHIPGTTDVANPNTSGIKAQIGYGVRGTNPWSDPSWIWLNMDLLDDTMGVFEYAKAITIPVGGYFDVAARFSEDGGFTYAYGDMDGDAYTSAMAAKLTVFGVPKGGAIVINELMWVGSSVSSSDEWFELRNMTQAPIKLDTFKLTGAGGPTMGKDFVFVDGVHTVNNSIIPPFGFFLVAQFDESNAKSALGIKPDIIANNTLKLWNTAPVDYKLMTADGKIIDQARFSGKIGQEGSTTYSKPFKSMERNEVPADGLKDENWHTATYNQGWDGDPLQKMNVGTPGFDNSDVRVCDDDADCIFAFAGTTLTNCQKRACVVATGRCDIVAIGNGDACDDGLFCTESEFCQDGVCGGGAPRDCSDQGDQATCTIDTCDDDADKCVHNWDPASKEGPLQSAACSDSADNDCDGLVDGDDPQCLLNVASVTPSLAPVDQFWTIDIAGTGLDIVQKVFFGDVEAQFTIVDASLVQATAPLWFEPADVNVVVSDDMIQQTVNKAVRFFAIGEGPIANTAAPAALNDVTVNTSSEMIYGRVFVDGYTTTDQDPNGIIAEIGYGMAGSDPYIDQLWVWTPATYDTACADCADVDAYQYMGTVTPVAEGAYSVAFRFSPPLNGMAKGYYYVYGDTTLQFNCIP